MDPLGFGLENFDAIGAWRDAEGETPVDASGELPDGRPFTDIRDFKRLVRGDDATLARNVAGQLITFATGSPVRFSERNELEELVARTRTSAHGVRSLVHAVVQSELFRRR